MRGERRVFQRRQRSVELITSRLGGRICGLLLLEAAARSSAHFFGPPRRSTETRQDRRRERQRSETSRRLIDRSIDLWTGHAKSKNQLAHNQFGAVSNTPTRKKERSESRVLLPRLHVWSLACLLALIYFGLLVCAHATAQGDTPGLLPSALPLLCVCARLR